MPYEAMTAEVAWFDYEIAGCHFADERLKGWFRKVIARMGGAVGQSIPLVCQDWANTKAAYRFFSNDRVSEADILAGHFQSTCERVGATDGLVFMLHDTTEFVYQRESSEAIGITKSVNTRQSVPRRASHIAARSTGRGDSDRASLCGPGRSFAEPPCEKIILDRQLTNLRLQFCSAIYSSQRT